MKLSQNSSFIAEVLLLLNESTGHEHPFTGVETVKINTKNASCSKKDLKKNDALSIIVDRKQNVMRAL